MIFRDPQKAQELLVAVYNGAARLRDADGIECIDTRRQRHRGMSDALPFQARVSIDLAPSQLHEFLDCIENPCNLVLVSKREPAF